ncbi:MAG: hypothetical protein NW226_08245 [Microscillaceae bacterium]|nr:hypothetical protein [Microscillaceae bacterium]
MGELRHAGSYQFMEPSYKAEDTFFPKDHVKTFWEDELLQFAVRSSIKKLVQKKQKENKRLRILEFGSKLGEGYDVLTKIKKDHACLQLQVEYILSEDSIELFLGLDTDHQRIEKANELTRHKKHARFIRTDYSEGMGLFKEVEAPFDIYFSREGAISELTIYELRDLMKDMIEHAASDSLLILDFKGKYAILHSFLLDHSEFTFWTGTEIQQFFKSLEEETGVQLEILRLMDRSILIASSQENRQYGHLFKHIRQAVNSLFEFNIRTDLQKLILKPEMFPNTSQAKIDHFFQELISWWNLIIQYAIKRFEQPLPPKELREWDNFPQAIQFGLLTLDRLIKDNEWIAYGDVRANLLEPHIGYMLRSLEFELQQGLGCGQNLSVIVQLKK